MPAHRIKALKYLSTLSLPATMALALLFGGWLCYLPLLYAFVLIPVVELFIEPRPENLTQAEEALAAEDRFYDWLLYLTVPVQFGMLFWYLTTVHASSPALWESIGLVLSMGILCGTFGINAGHELGHRSSRFERTLAKMALSSSLYMHFFIEHNRGHHHRVATPDDPATARLGESIYAFWPRTLVLSFISAWELEAKRLVKRKRPLISLHNEMLRFLVIQAALLVGIALVFSIYTMLFFLMSAIVGILLLETVNYIEHYGLVRRRRENGQYERTTPHHSWNSNHVIGRIMLFELSRHSDHHHQASRKYQILRHHDDSPQMPTGYPGMMMMALVPPAWFHVMHRELQNVYHSSSLA